jgi:hypothetical protein
VKRRRGETEKESILKNANVNIVGNHSGENKQSLSSISTVAVHKTHLPSLFITSVDLGHSDGSFAHSVLERPQCFIAHIDQPGNT